MPKTANHDWKPSRRYKEPDYERMDRMNPFLHCQYIASETKRMEEKAIEDFVVTKLPAGGVDDHLNFKFSNEVIDNRVKAGRGGSPGHEKVEEQSVEQLKAVEARISEGKDYKTELNNEVNPEV